MAVTLTTFIWFIWALAVTLSNVVFGLVVFIYLDRLKNTGHVKDVKKLVMWYIVGMMFVLMISILAFILSTLPLV